MSSSDLLFNAILRGDEINTRHQLEHLAAGATPADQILNESCIPAILEVKHRVDAGDIYVPELLISQRAFLIALETLRFQLPTQTYDQALAHSEVDLQCFL